MMLPISALIIFIVVSVLVVAGGWMLSGRSTPPYVLTFAFLLLAAAGLAAHFGHRGLWAYLSGAGSLPRALMEPLALILAASSLVVGARALLIEQPTVQDKTPRKGRFVS